MSAVALLAGFAADALLGDPRRGHPVAGFGRVAGRVERTAWAPSRMRGAVAAAALAGGAAGLGELSSRLAERRLPRGGRPLVLTALTWTALGGRSLGAVATAIAHELERGDLPAARAALPALVGRDPSHLDAAGATRAVVESVAENTSDAVVGALVWAALAGPAGAAGFRAVNTLDAMWGHRTDRHADFGWAAARLDDAAGWLPARVAVGLVAALAPLAGGSPRVALAAARADGAAHPSPNAGPVEAAFAGALGVRLGGPLRYGDRAETRPVLHPAGREVVVGDIARAVRLSRAVGAATALGAAALRRRRAGR